MTSGTSDRVTLSAGGDSTDEWASDRAASGSPPIVSGVDQENWELGAQRDSKDMQTPTEQPINAPRTPEDCGAILRARRVDLGLTVRNIADKTRVPVRYLNKLEEGCWLDLPGYAHGMGFLRSYAMELKIDYSEIINIYRAFLQEGDAPASGGSPSEMGAVSSRDEARPDRGSGGVFWAKWKSRLVAMESQGLWTSSKFLGGCAAGLALFVMILVWQSSQAPPLVPAADDIDEAAVTEAAVREISRAGVDGRGATARVPSVSEPTRLVDGVDPQDPDRPVGVLGEGTVTRDGVLGDEGSRNRSAASSSDTVLGNEVAMVESEARSAAELASARASGFDGVEGLEGTSEPVIDRGIDGSGGAQQPFAAADELADDDVPIVLSTLRTAQSTPVLRPVVEPPLFGGIGSIPLPGVVGDSRGWRSGLSSASPAIDTDRPLRTMSQVASLFRIDYDPDARIVVLPRQAQRLRLRSADDDSYDQSVIIRAGEALSIPRVGRWQIEVPGGAQTIQVRVDGLPVPLTRPEASRLRLDPYLLVVGKAYINEPDPLIS